MNSRAAGIARRLGPWLSCLVFVAPAVAAAPDDAQTSVAVAARIDGAIVPYAELSARAAQKLARQQAEYELQTRRLAKEAARAKSEQLESELGELVDERVLALEAAARGTTAAQLLDTLEIPALTDAELRKFYDSRRSQVHQPFDAVKTDIEEYLRGEAVEEARLRYLEALREKHHAVILWDPLREPVEPAGPRRGPADARITIVEFSDFQCPFCGRLAPLLKRLQSEYPDTVRVVFRNLPLRKIHPDAATAAQAGVCAASQGMFWQMHDAMYADQASLGEHPLEDKARRLGLDAKRFNDCLESGQGTAAVLVDEHAAEQLGLSGTPSSFVNGRFINGAAPHYQWKALIDDELSRVR